MIIDAVIPWVDSNDPSHRSKIARYASGDETSRPDVGGATRFASVGEIRYCVASLNRFAPFLHKIYIITDAQDPGLDGFLYENFPGGYIPMEIVDHKEIFRGFEQYLPVFNSRAIETMMWRIPGLSEHFLLLNDDFLLCRKVSEGDFFTPDGRPVCYARRMSVRWGRLLRSLKPRKHGRRNVSFKESMMNAAALSAPESAFFLRLEHTPRALLRSWYEDFFARREAVLVYNIRHRFREATQYNAEEIQYLPLYREGRCILRDPREFLFIVNVKAKDGYVAAKMKKLESFKPHFCCFNSLDQASEQDRALVFDYISKVLDIKL